MALPWVTGFSPVVKQLFQSSDIYVYMKFYFPSIFTVAAFLENSNILKLYTKHLGLYEEQLRSRQSSACVLVWWAA